jgi:hypothetical protein
MRKYFDADGHETTAGNATSSKGCQGPVAGCLGIVAGLFILLVLITWLAHGAH